jgi:hypothetical protein
MENLYTVSQVFSDRLFHVPDYQRGYAWDKQQCDDFIADLELLGAGKEHFFGLLILHEMDGHAKVMDERGRAYERFDVVDGQQRLTTLVLYLHALRKEMADWPSLAILAQGLEESYEATRDMNGQPMPKVTLNRDTQDYFYECILDHAPDVQGPTIRSQVLLGKAEHLFGEYMKDRRKKQIDSFSEWLKAEYLKVTQQLTFVLYTVRSDADAGVVFETMNNRGQQLTELEKVKNYLLYLCNALHLPADHGLAQDINATWTLIFERLMKADLASVDHEDQLLRVDWIMAHDHDPRKWQRSRSIKERFSLSRYQGQHPELLKELKTYLSGLRNAAVAYCDVLSPSGPGAYSAFRGDVVMHRRLATSGERLARLEAPAAFLPLLMAIRIRYPEDGAAILEALDLCERFAFRVYRWVRRPASTGQSKLFRLGNLVYHGEPVAGALNTLRSEVLYYCPNEQIAGRFEDRNWDWYSWGGLKYMLYEYEQHLADDAGQPVHMPWKVLARKHDTIEHILPQTLAVDSYWAAVFTPDEHARLVNDIGNLTLTYDNSGLGNRPFADKKGAIGKNGSYAASKLFIEQEIARYEDWTPQTVETRRQQFAAWVAKRWEIATAAGQSLDVTEDAATLILRVLNRTFIPRGQLLLYKALYVAEDGDVSQAELHQKLGVKGRQMSGVLGGLGNRINQTDGLRDTKPGMELLVRWRSAEGLYWYAMQPQLRSVINGLPKLRDVLTTWSIGEINAEFDAVWQADWLAQRTALGLPDEAS